LKKSFLDLKTLDNHPNNLSMPWLAWQSRETFPPGNLSGMNPRGPNYRLLTKNSDFDSGGTTYHRPNKIVRDTRFECASTSWGWGDEFQPNSRLRDNE
jgi:hypothetical protein